MRSTLLHQSDGRRTFEISLERGEHVIACLAAFAREHDCRDSEFSATGGVEWARLMYHRIESDDHIELPLQEATGLLSLTGRIGPPAAAGEDGSRLVVHCVLGHSDGSAVGGRLVEAEVRPACEVVLTDYQRS